MLKTRVNGLELAYERRGHGSALVLIHGYPLDHTIWESVAPFLENDFDLFIPDLPGFGQSQAFPGPYQLTDVAGNLAAWFESLKIKKVAVAGHSMGGYVALAFANAYPECIYGLGLIASQAGADTPERKDGRFQTAAKVEENGVGEVADSMSTLLTADIPLQTRLKKLISQQTPAGVAGNLRAMAGRGDSIRSLAKFDFPVVIIHGQADRIIPIERARETKAAAENCLLTEIAEAGHMPMLEAPEKTAQALRALK